MPISEYMQRLRDKVGHDLLLMPSVTVITFDAEGRVLLAKHADAGVWVAPGGSIEPNESPADAAVREMWEETGLLVEPVRVLGVYGGPDFLVTYSNRDQVSYVMVVFECRLVKGRLAPDGDETIDLAYYSESDMVSLKLAPWVPIVIVDAFKEADRAAFQSPAWKPPDNLTANSRT